MSKPSKVGYSQTYPIGQTGQFQKIWVELEMDATDDPRTELYKCKKIVNDFFFESNKAAEKQQQEIKKEEPQSQEARIIAQIKEITDPKVLEWFALLAKKYPNVQLAYNHKLKQLQS